MPELVCVWKPDPDSASGCGAPVSDVIVFDPESASMFPDPAIPVCAEHYAACSSWVSANLGPVVGSRDPLC